MTEGWTKASGGFSRLRALYAQLDEELLSFAGECRACGNCCRFAEYDHLLFAVPLEAVYLLSGGLPFGFAGKDGADWTDRDLNRAAERCPWQDEGFCTARERRLLGCRTFFCDEKHAEPRRLLHEKYLLEIRELNAACGCREIYAPLHELIRVLSGA